MRKSIEDLKKKIEEEKEEEKQEKEKGYIITPKGTKEINNFEDDLKDTTSSEEEDL